MDVNVNLNLAGGVGADVPKVDGGSLTPLQVDAWIGLARDGAKAL